MSATVEGFVTGRLEKLERQNRRLRAACFSALVVAAVALGLAIQRPTAADGKTIEAAEFRVVDEKGKVRVRINDGGITTVGGSVELINYDDTYVVVQLLNGDAGQLVLRDADGDTFKAPSK